MAPLEQDCAVQRKLCIYHTDYRLGVPDSSENLQSRCGLKWKEVQREND